MTKIAASAENTETLLSELPEIPVIVPEKMPELIVLPDAPEVEEQDVSGAMKYTTVKSLRYATSDRLFIDAIITFAGLGAIPFTLGPNDDTPHGIELYADVLAGKHGPIADYIPPSSEDLAVDARYWRDKELRDSQWLVDRHRDQLEAAASTSLSASKYAELQAYRQALRTWPTGADFPGTRPTTPQWLVPAEAEAPAL